MYQPRISDENIRRLYQLRIKAKKPMTRVLDEILNEYFSLQSLYADKETQKNFKSSNFII